jgi:hypothetical protein
MTAIPFPSITAPGSLSEAGGRLINCYPEKLEDSRVVRKIAAGLRQATNTGATGNCRGQIEVTGTLLSVIGTRVYAVTRSGAGVYSFTDLGALPGSGPVFFARNNAATPQIVGVTGSTAYVFTIGGAPALYSVTDPDVASPTSACFQGGYFIFGYGNGEMRATGINVLSIATTDYATAESKPDGVTRIVPRGDEILAFGAQTIEFWRNTGASPGFPYDRVTVANIGLAGSDAVAGWEDGFPPDSIIFVGSDSVVYKLAGYQPQPIAPNWLTRRIEAVTDRTTLEACVYMHGGHSVWQLSCAEWTVCHDLSTGAWYERNTNGEGRFQAQRAVRAFDRWICGSSLSGQLFEIDDGYRAEASDPIEVVIQSATMSAFPKSAFARQIAIDCMMGVGDALGDAPESEPSIGVSWSHDGGATFGSPVMRGIGPQGDYRRRITVSRAGRITSNGMAVRLTYSGKTAFTHYGGDIEVIRHGQS